ncbi:hypothetical protein NL676_017328 [Syzygium grande]|nr:hypothetical protein NL676_017328 [Syzygium grande]
MTCPSHHRRYHLIPEKINVCVSRDALDVSYTSLDGHSTRREYRSPHTRPLNGDGFGGSAHVSPVEGRVARHATHPLRELSSRS